MKVKDKEKLNSPMKGWQILNASSLMGFHTVECKASAIYQKKTLRGVLLKSCQKQLEVNARAGGEGDSVMFVSEDPGLD